MSRLKEGFFHYRLPPEAAAPWGVAVHGGGAFAAQAGEPYPPVGHPSDHTFEWETGRALGAFQVVLIAQGRGEFESRATGRVELVAGNALVLLPGVWHRYRPDPATGWTEKWIEFGGELPARLVKAKVLAPERAVVAVVRPAEMEARLDHVHGVLRSESDGAEAELAAGALGVLALLQERAGALAEDRPAAVAVQKAKRLLEAEGAAVPRLPELARSLGVGYSSFRREFRRRTGLSPQQYLLRVRLQRVQRLLGNTDQPIKEIAERLGFSSPYHLSATFSQYFGIAPSEWRRRARPGG